MEVYGYDPFISVEAAWKLSRDVHHTTDVNEIYRECDYITIHVPLMDSTKGMIGADAIALMKPSVVVLNFARGPLVDQKAIVEALKTNRIHKYVTDFPTTDLANLKNAIVIPHLGASTKESEDNCAVMAVCKDAMRVTIIHRNIPNMLTKFTAAFGDLGINIEKLTNVTRGEYGYVMIDLGNVADEEEIEKIRAIEGVLRVRTM